MYCGIEVVSKPVDQWSLEDLREFIGRNGEYLIGISSPAAALFADDLEKVGRDFEMVAQRLDSIIDIAGLTEKVDKLQNEVWNLEDADCDNCVDLEDQLGQAKRKITSLEEQLASREE